MSLIFERIETDGIAELSYLLGDDGAGIAAVFDPTPDVDKYVELAREKNVSITHIFETHIHADLMSGSRELCARVDSAEIYGSGEEGAEYGFAINKIKDRNTFDFGKTRVTVRHTPGHTPEHVSYELAEKENPKKPWGVLTGDSLFVSSAGRPDLLGSAQAKKLAAQQFHTLRDYFLKLPDSVIIHPGHGAGSPCGADIGDRLESTIGYERDSNPFLQFTNVKEFTDYALSTAPPVPTYYPRMKKVNAKGPEIIGNLPRVAAMSAQEFKRAVDKKAGVLIDTRDMLAFGGGHIEGALNIGGSPMLSIWAGWFLNPKTPVLLVLESDSKIDEVVKLFIRTGYTKFAGYLAGGMKAWNSAGLPIEELPQISVHQLKGALDETQIFDVRSPDEWNGGHIPNAQHLFLPEIRKKAAQFDKTKPTAVYCASGYRASLGASMLQQEGFTNVHNVPGSWGAWKSAKFPIEKTAKAS
ncbi:MAG: rhodanese-like domain-containing protein [Chthoniobacterales bacterium]